MLRLNYMINVDAIGTYPDKEHIFHFPSNGDCWLYEYLTEWREQKAQERAIIDMTQKRINAVLKATRSEATKMIESWGETEKNQVMLLMTQDQKQQLALILNPPRYYAGEKLHLQGDVGETLVTIRLVQWDSTHKQHVYFIEGSEVPYYESNFFDQTVVQLKGAN